MAFKTSGDQESEVRSQRGGSRGKHPGKGLPASNSLQNLRANGFFRSNVSRDASVNKIEKGETFEFPAARANEQPRGREPSGFSLNFSPEWRQS